MALLCKPPIAPDLPPDRTHLPRWTAAGLAALLSGCGMMPDAPTIGLMNHGQPETAVAHISASSGSEVSGEVHFTQRGSDTLVEINLSHLSPGAHGFHIHEHGDCSAPDALSAGGHFNPAGQPHGGPEGPHHLGDLGNVTAGSDGMVNENIHVKGLELSGDNGVIGRALVVHSAPDDLATQPSGNSGKRVGCGIIVHS